jgi:DNA helicase-4
VVSVLGTLATFLVPTSVVTARISALSTLFTGFFVCLPLFVYHWFQTRTLATRWQKTRGIFAFGIWFPIINIFCLVLYVVIGPWNVSKTEANEGKTTPESDKTTTETPADNPESDKTTTETPADNPESDKTTTETPADNPESDKTTTETPADKKGDGNSASVESELDEYDYMTTSELPSGVTVDDLKEAQPELTRLQEEFVDGLLPATAVAVYSVCQTSVEDTEYNLSTGTDGPLPPVDESTVSCPWCGDSIENDPKAVQGHWRSGRCIRITDNENEVEFPVTIVAEEQTGPPFQHLIEEVRQIKSAVPDRMPYRPLGSEGNHQKIRVNNIADACEQLEPAISILQSNDSGESDSSSRSGSLSSEDVETVRSHLSTVQTLGTTRIGEVIWDTNAEVLCNHLEEFQRNRFHASIAPQVHAIETAIDTDDAEGGFEKLQELSEQLYRVDRSVTESVQETAEELQSILVTEQIDRINSKLDTLLEVAAPYYRTTETEGYQQYLTAAEYDTLDESITRVRAALDSLDNEIVPRFQSEGVTTKLANLKTEVSLLEEQHGNRQRYNREFVHSQIQACDDLFSNIGEKSLTLNDTQRKAVVRNDVYNQVVAAAGTGKTMVLIVRIVYLIRARGVAPEDILALAYTREAKEEMETRLATQFDITDVAVRTLHAHARQLVRKKNRRPIEMRDTNDLSNLVREMVRDAPEETPLEFQKHLYEFLTRVDDRVPESTDFETKEAYYEARRAQTYVTLQGENVKSEAEKQIADFLFTNQITYRYEDLASWAETADDRNEYRPDFYLPEHDTYIEHLGIDTAGQVAEWFSWDTSEYHEKVKWSRQQFANTEATLLETYEFEHAANRLDDILRARLVSAGVELNQLPLESLINQVYHENHQAYRVQSAFESFVENAKRFQLKPSDIDPKLTESDPRQYHFAKCGIRILQRYQQFLVTNGLHEFADIIAEATNYLDEGPESAHQHEHVLVDEFQDISVNQHEFINALTGPDAAQLFCVGDDWQSIYSFQGVDVDRFIDFEDHYGDAARTELIANYRSPTSVINAGNELVTHNEDHVKKTVEPKANFDTTPLIHQLDGYTHQAYTDRQGAYIARLVTSYLEDGASLDEIMVLCRYDKAAPYLSAVKKNLKQLGVPFSGKSEEFRPSNNTTHDAIRESDAGAVSVYSVHQSKGREARHTILAHLVEGLHDFPSLQRDEALLAPVCPIEIDPLAEERRLFYVAITRTAGTLDIITQPRQHSRFLEEIDEFTESAWDKPTLATQAQPGTQISTSGTVTNLEEQTHHKIAQSGEFEDPTAVLRFVSWLSNDPPELQLGKGYELSDVAVEKYKSSPQLNLKQNTKVTNSEQNDEIPTGSITLEQD